MGFFLQVEFPHFLKSEFLAIVNFILAFEHIFGKLMPWTSLTCVDRFIRLHHTQLE